MLGGAPSGTEGGQGPHARLIKDCVIVDLNGGLCPWAWAAHALGLFIVKVFAPDFAEVNVAQFPEVQIFSVTSSPVEMVQAVFPMSLY